MAKRPLLSLCMIVKDGGAALTRCLESARGVADEIVVVDTGSQDESVARAESAGARVLRHPWDDDFAAARNVGLEAARGEWILLLDCDERFDPPRPRQLRDALSRPEYVAYFLTVESELAPGDRLDSTILRLWRHSRDVRFRYPIHEQVLPDLEQVAARTGQRFALLSDVKVAHDGYTPSAIAAHGKIERNLRLFRKAVARHPDEPYLHYKFADFLRSHPEHKVLALAEAEKALALITAGANGSGGAAGRRKVPYWSELLTILCASQLESGRRGEALALLEAEPPGELGSPHYSYVAALAFEGEGRVDEALVHITTCCGAERPTHLTAWRPTIAGSQGEALRARLLLKKGAPREALVAAERALAARPGYPAAIQLKADALLAADGPKEALRFLRDAVAQSPHEPRLWQQIGALLQTLGRPDEARRCLARAESIPAS